MIVLNPLFGLLYLIVLGLDIVVFFLIVHLVVTKWHVQRLVSLDRIGGDIVEKVTASIGGFLSRNSVKKLSRIGNVLASILILTMIRLGLVLLMRCVD